ncbi:MAG TPA: TIGR01777 family oxidoreductase [Chitinophagaceae bacterium]|nr:TIGR01777 family oxidoreductase [Chitinophagaceae bacterium]
METVLITGGTGMIGKALTQALIERGFNVIILTRHINDQQKTKNDKLSYAIWDVEKQTIDKNAFAKADYIIHLAGASVAEKRWTKKRKQEIVSSRVDSGKLIADSLKNLPNKVKTVVSATAIGWYGPDKNDGKKFTEDDPSSIDFLGQTCKQWEAAIEPASFLGKRLVKLRIGIVLSNEGGAYVEFKKPLKFRVATILGNGKQIVSWIHIDDLIRAIFFAMENEKMEGVYNAVAPHPVSNKELVLEIARRERGKSFIPVHVPTFALKIRLGEMSVEVLKSATVSSEKIQQAGFIFQYPDLQSAISQLASQKNLPG